MIVSRFTSFNEKLVIRNFQITEVSALGTTVPVRFLQEALAILGLEQMLQFRSFGK